jgi:exportin-5
MYVDTVFLEADSMFEMVIFPPQALVHQRVAEQALLTLQGYLDWVKFNILFIQDCILLQVLCLLLDEEQLKISACECLLIIVSRKVQ